jgi:formate hydrogenlyase subunit 3/multisubunit Na+/H+ antiporter MnhD subunit
MMWNQPAFWLMSLPLLAAVVLWPAARWPRAQAVAGAGVAWLLALWLWLLAPGPGAVWELFGLSFSLTPGLQMFFVLLYLSLGLLNLFAWPFPAGPRFAPITLALMAPAAAMLMARPFLVVAPFWLLLVFTALLLFRYEDGTGIAAVQAALRYWLLMLVATVLLLIAVWMLAGAQVALLLPGGRLLVLALGIMLAGFPFFIWVRPLVTAVPLPALPLLLAILPLLVVVLVIQLLAAYPALAQTDAYLVWLPWSAGLTVLLAGFLALSAGSWRRMAASLILLDMGFGLLALALAATGGWQTAVVLPGLRLVSLLLVVVGLGLVDGDRYSVMSRSDRFAYGEQYSGEQRPAGVVEGLKEVVQQVSWPLWLLIYGLFSLLGLPLTPGFSGRWAVLVALGRSEMASLVLALLLLAGMGLALLGLGRQIQTALSRETTPGEPVSPGSGWPRLAALATLLLALLLAAFPQLLLAPLNHLLNLF